MSGSDFYPATGWRTIFEAKTDAAAMERLLLRYQAPIRLEISSRARCSPSDLDDLTQQFIENCLRRDFLRRVDRENGRFRWFIKRCIVNFLCDRGREITRQPSMVALEELERGGSRPVESADELGALESHLDADWAHQVVRLAMESLREECVNARRGSLFLRLKPFLHGDSDGDSYDQVASDLGTTARAVRTAVYRFRRRLGELIREEIRETVASEDELRTELRYFLDLLGGIGLAPAPADEQRAQ